jgi:hypothetical protein
MLEMNCNQTAMGFPSVTSAIFLIVILVKCGFLEGIFEMFPAPSGISKE